MNDTIDQQDAQIERYLANRMSADEHAQFEIRMLEEPELLERVQLLDALRTEMRANELQLQDTRDDIASQRTATVLTFANWMRQPLSLAASLLIAVLATYQLFDEPPASAITSIPIGAVVLLDGTRGENSIRVVGSGPVLLQIDAGLDAQGTSFGVSVNSTATGAVVAEVSGLNADSNGWVRLLLNEIPAGEHRVELNWQDAQGATQVRQYLLQFEG